MAETAMQGAGLLNRSNLGFSILLKDISVCSQGNPGIKPATFCLLEDPLHLLSYSSEKWYLQQLKDLIYSSIKYYYILYIYIYHYNINIK